ncbi:MAG: hypothetical protein G01um101420_135 [Parcubacteria group bacterium Gr01-1014_20]|nr:MAG: hypothetical protein G01um101420_135 [Parcubacteria group bacterium Gr01-1014_20]
MHACQRLHDGFDLIGLLALGQFFLEVFNSTGFFREDAEDNVDNPPGFGQIRDVIFAEEFDPGLSDADVFFADVIATGESVRFADQINGVLSLQFLEDLVCAQSSLKIDVCQRFCLAFVYEVVGLLVADENEDGADGVGHTDVSCKVESGEFIAFSLLVATVALNDQFFELFLEIGSFCERANLDRVLVCVGVPDGGETNFHLFSKVFLPLEFEIGELGKDGGGPLAHRTGYVTKNSKWRRALSGDAGRDEVGVFLAGGGGIYVASANVRVINCPGTSEVVSSPYAGIKIGTF